MSVAVQGFGNVGSFFAKLIGELGAKVVAISDSTGGVHNAKGLDVAAAFAHKRSGGSLSELKGGDRITNEELVEIDCDVFAPCALEQVVTEENAAEVKAKVIVEGANGPLTPAADEILESNDVLILPDVLANAGGVVVSYFEWVQGLQEYFWKEDEVNARLNEIVTPRLRRDLGDLRTARSRCGWRHTGLRSSASPRRRSRAASTPEQVTLLSRAGLLALRAGRGVLDRVGAPYEAVDITGDGARGALPRMAAGRRDRRRAGVRLLRRRGSPAPKTVTNAVLRDNRTGVIEPWAQCARDVASSRSGRAPDRLTVGVAARLSRYLQVLTQSKKMGKDRISSQEIADYTNINATQIRRDLSNFGKFGKRGVGYSIDSLLSEIRKILRTQGQHNIALVGAGRLGQAIASSPIFAEHGINIAAVFDSSPDVIGADIGGVTVEDEGRLKDVVRDKNIVVGVLAVPAGAAQKVADDLVDAGVRIIFNYSEAPARRSERRDRAHLEPRGRAVARAVLPPRVALFRETTRLIWR